MSKNAIFNPGHLTGGCRCGEIEYLCRSEPVHVSNCHCLDCQKSSGAPFMSWALFEAKDFILQQGRATEISFTDDVVRGFCGRCGTHLYWRKRSEPQWIDLTVGSFDNPLPLKPQSEAFVSRKLPWIILQADLPHHQRGPFESAPIDASESPSVNIELESF